MFYVSLPVLLAIESLIFYFPSVPPCIHYLFSIVFCNADISDDIITVIFFAYLQHVLADIKAICCYNNRQSWKFLFDFRCKSYKSLAFTILLYGLITLIYIFFGIFYRFGSNTAYKIVSKIYFCLKYTSVVLVKLIISTLIVTAT